MARLFFKEKVFKYDPALLNEWLKGDLKERWHKKYRELFRKDDLTITKNQSKQHFGEWFTAIKYLEKGWKVFMEHYVYAYSKKDDKEAVEAREKKNDEVKRIVGEGNFYFLSHLGGTGKRPPDLFVFNDKKYFFAEVKLNNDRLKPDQEAIFKQVKERLGVEIHLVSVLPKI